MCQTLRIEMNYNELGHEETNCTCMKKISIILFVLVLLIALPTHTWAYDVEIDGICYILNNENNTASVTKRTDKGADYSGTISIPETINYNNIIYSVTSIGREAFLSCSNLGSINIPASVTEIGYGAFDGCSNLTFVYLPFNLNRIGDAAFRNCTSLPSINIPENVSYIGSAAFSSCYSITTMNLPSKLTDILLNTFSNCTNLTSLTIPASVTTIGKMAFVGCSSLKSVEIPGSIIVIEDFAFSDCTGLISIVFSEGLITIGEGAFANCRGLISVNFPNTLQFLRSSVFSGCNNLTSIVVPGNVTDIPMNAFKSCSRLTTLSIGDGVTKIGFHAFSGCTSLNTVTISNSVSSIDAMAFKDCSSLTSVTIPYNVNMIGGGAFYNCSSLNSVISEIVNPFSIDESVFEGIPSSSELNVPKGTKSKYLQFSGWTKHFGSISGQGDDIVYDIVIKAIGYGSVQYEGSSIRDNSNSFTLKEGSSATITISPDNGYRIKSVKVNSTDVTSSVSNNSYTISSISANTTLEVEFEAIPIPSYTLSVKAIGNGSATYNGTTVKNNTQTFTLNEGTSATITFAPDNGYRIKSVKVNSTDATSSVSNNSYTVSNISSDTTVEIEFEAIPIPTYTLSIKATGNGSATYDGTSAKNNTQTFTLNEGTSATITFAPDNGYRIKSVKVNSTDVTSSVSNNSYTISSISANTTVEVEFEAIPIPTYTLSIKATGNGSASYNGTTAKNNTQTFTLNEGTSATITFAPDNGYRIKSVKVNSTDVTSSVSNNSYTISSISANTTAEVEFEAIPIPTYTLSLKATGNGSATYNGTTAKNNTQSFTLNEGTSATITFSPDNGYRIKSVKVNNTDVTSSVSNNSYTVSSIKANTTVEVVFEAIPITTYTLSIKATGNGSATYDGTTAKNSTKSFTLSEGTSATITFIPDNGYRIKSVKVNSTDVTSSVSNNQYTVSKIKANTTVEVEFEAIPITTYTLSIKATGNGSASYDGTTAKNNTKSFTVNEGANATITFSPDNGYRIKSVKVNSTDVTSSVSNNQYTVSNIKANTTVEVEFEAIPVTTYTLSIKATGNGSATYDGTTAKNNTKSFTLDEGTSATITFAPDNGHRIKSVKVNSTDVTSSVSNNQYTVSNIKANTSVEVEFETIPVTTYTLSVKATGNGSATYNGTTAKNNTQTFTLNEGTSATISFAPDNGYRIKSVKVNSTDVTSSVSNSNYTVSNIKANTTVEVEFEAIPVTTYTLSIKATGSGSATYDGTTAKNNTQTFTLNEGTSATITFAPDNGYRIKSVKVNSTDVTSSVANNIYTVSNIKANTTVEVEFEAIPVTTYTLSIKATGNGSATYDGTTAKNNTQTFTLNEGTSATITFSPDNGCRIKSVKVNSTDVTANVSYSQYTVSNISTDITVEVEFEAIPVNTYILKYVVDDETYKTYELSEGAAITPEAEPTKEGYTFSGWSEIPATMPAEDVTITGSFTKNEPEIKTYALSIRAIGSGSASYSGTTIINSTRTFTVNEGTSATITFSPDNGYRIKSVTENGTDVTLSVSFSQYTINNISANTTIEVEFEAIPVNTYTLKYVVDGETYKTYELKEGAVILPEAEPTKEGYTFSGWSEIPETMPAEDITITGTFTKIESLMTVDGVNYETVSFSEHLVVVAEGDYGPVLEVPETITYENETWTVMGLKDGALENCENLAAVIWDPSAVFNARVSNPNLLLYVKDKSNASYGVKNVIVNKKAESIELTDASSGNDFYCPRAFKAKKISYSHRYNMETGLGDSKGWETIVLPFDVQKYTSPKGEIIPFTKWANSDSKKPFWLFELTASGYKDVEGIKANTPYIISMPNNPQYQADYVIIGLVTFSAENAEVKASDEMQSANYQDRTFVPNYTNKAGEDCLALNVNNYYVTNPGTDIDGSKFIKGLRAVHPFEAYMTTTSNTRSIDVMDGMTTAIRDIIIAREGTDDIKVYDTRGILVKTAKTNDNLREGLAAGVYIVNGKKMIIK